MKTTLKQAIIEQLGYSNEIETELVETCSDIANNDFDGGFGNFIYYSDTVKFFDDNKESIIDSAQEMAGEFGQTTSEMIAGFNCLDLSAFEVEAVLFGIDTDENATTVKNALAWFVAEEYAREVADSNDG